MPSPDRVAIAHERIAARARRIRLIRQRVVAGTLAAFVLAWGLVVFDGSMGSETASSQIASTASATTSSGDTTSSSQQDTYSSEDSTSTDDSTSSSSDDSAATMTTTQS